MHADRAGTVLTVAGAAASMAVLAIPLVNISRLDVTAVALISALLVALLGWSLRLAAGRALCDAAGAGARLPARSV